MNADFRVSVDFFSHHKARKLRKRLGATALLSLLQLWAYAAKVRTDGNLSGMTPEDIELVSEWEGQDGEFVAILLEVGFLDQGEGGLLLHDWAENNPWVAEEKSRRERAQKNATSGWEKRKNKQLHDSGNADSMPRQSDGNATAKQLHDSGNAPSPSPSPSPSPEENETSSHMSPGNPATDAGAEVCDTEKPPENHAPPCPHQEIIAEYHDILPELRKVKVWNSQREKHLSARWKEQWKRGMFRDRGGGLAYFRKVFTTIRNSDFLMGRTSQRDGRSFYADLPWMVRPENFAKIIEGRYFPREDGDYP
ncbi:MAG: hypothetical protein LBR94_00820 [Desulfovibrio sp.]|jgi:hypothetical protein|nr:hypothetical protein [Desulfovibrio sp.]